MSLFVASLNSGSNGNCYYVGNDDNAVLIDAGISCREIEKRMRRLDLSMQKVRAIFVSHEHADHINGIPVLSKKYQVPVYITAPTLLHSGIIIDQHLVFSFRQDERVSIGNLSVLAFSKNHDAVDPHSFLIEYNGVCVGVFTDIGIACTRVVHHFKQCHAAFLESNYDEGMLESGSYPFHLKKRIRDGQGHLSNTQALQLLLDHKPAFMSHLFLSHLSQNNNNPELVKDLFRALAKEMQIIIASRYEETPVYEIISREQVILEAFPKTAIRQRPKQLSLF